MSNIDPNQLKEALLCTLSPDLNLRGQAESFLRNVEKTPGYSLALLQLLQSSSDAKLSQICAVTFKNFVKRYWSGEEIEGGRGNALPESDRAAIKTHIVNLMCTTPPLVQAQISEALSLISVHDFPAKWESLLPELISKLSTSDWKVTHGVLMTANSIFKRFRYVFKSDELFRELKYCLEQFQMFKMTSEAITANQKNKETLVQIFLCLRLLCRIFFSLNYQDLPEFFEDHIQDFMGYFATYLSYENPLLVDSSEENEPGPLDQVQAAIVENLILYADKYLEELKTERLQTFTQLVWTLTTKVTTQPKHDILTTTCIRFLTSVVSQATNKPMFQDPNTLRQICDNIVVPNLMLRDEEEELFEDNPMDYIRRDIEGSDSDTRRRSACDLVRGLLKQFQEPVTQICQGILSNMLQRYAGDRQQWKAKDASINLVIALAVKAQTKAKGATQTNELINVMDFFSSHILPELQSPEGTTSPIIKADAIKFVSTFRNQISADIMKRLIPLLINHMRSDQFVVHTYAAACVERVLTVKDKGPDGRLHYRFGRTDLQQFLEPIFTALFGILERPNYPENDYVMKAIMRVINVAQEDIVSAADIAIQKLTAVLGRICSNPTNPLFSHYLFESISVLVRNAAKTNAVAVEKCEQLLFPPFQTVLSMDVESLAPYVFQVLAQLLDFRPGGLSPAFRSLLQPLLAPPMWERRANIPAMTRLLCSYVKKAPQEIDDSSLKGILGVFQKLIASKINEHHGFDLLRSVFGKMALQQFGMHLETIIRLLMTRLSANMTVKFATDYVVALSVLCGKHGVEGFMQACEAIQPGMFVMFTQQVWFPNVRKINGNAEKKTVAIGSTRLLIEGQPLHKSPDLLVMAITGILSLLELPTDRTTDEDVDDEEGLEELMGYSAGFSKLHFAASDQDDYFKDLDPRVSLAQGLVALNSKHPELGLKELIGSRVDPSAQQLLQQYFVLAKVSF